MDTNLKNNKFSEEKSSGSKLLKSTFGTILLVFLLAAISVGSYLPVKRIVSPPGNNTRAYFQSAEFSYLIADLTRYLVKPKPVENYYYNERLEDIESVKYVIKKKDVLEVLSNITAAEDYDIEEQKEKSQFFLQLKVDETGKAVIENSSGIKFDKNNFLQSLGLRNDSNKDLVNLEVIYMIPQDLGAYNDIFTNSLTQYNLQPSLIMILIIGGISVLILAIIALSIPYSYQRKANLCNLYNKMFLELKFILCLALGGIFIAVMDSTVNSLTINQGFTLETIIDRVNAYFYLIGIPVTFTLFLIIYLTIVYFKYIYYMGIKDGFIKNSIFGAMALYILKRLRNLIRRIFSIDINKKEDEKLIIILVINLFVLWIIAATSFFGVILAIGYTIFLFRYLQNEINKIKTLNEGSKKLAQGNFDVIVDENIGILTPIATNLNNIKSGFKTAIHKELVSEKMKTELISNVSHDLKTPLTSIITYVDLLKDEKLNEENRREYIQILDRKSKRLKDLIEDLFEASKATSGNVELQLNKLDVVALFKQTLGELEEKLNNSTLQIKVTAPEHKILCNLDGRRTYRVFENIMGNILKYSMDNSRVYINIEEDEKEVNFTFKNISAYEMNFNPEEITERFTRGDKSRNTEGSGLGLAIAKSLVELQRGSLKITVDGDLFKLKVSFPKAELV